jgi:hypothetical protein
MEHILVREASRILVQGPRVMRVETWHSWEGWEGDVPFPTIVIEREGDEFKCTVNALERIRSKKGNLDQVLEDFTPGRQIAYSLLFGLETVTREILEQLGFRGYKVVDYDAFDEG